MPNFVSRSQAGQDAWVHEQLPQTDGTFLDIGCNHPSYNNNSYSLELLGWRGLLMDLNPEWVACCRAHRASPVVHADALLVDWPAVVKFGPEIDYLSLDIDDWPNQPPKTPVVLANLFAAGFSFRAITVEHDRYRLGDGIRNSQRELLTAHGYRLLVADVPHDNLEYEDWWVRP